MVSGANSALGAMGLHNNELTKAIKALNSKNIRFVDNPKDADLTHYVGFHPFFISLPFFKPSKKVVLTIHDLHRLIYPNHFPPGIKGSLKFLINKFLIWKNVDRIITISETSKKDISRFLGVNPDKIFVTYLGIKKAFKKLAKEAWETEIRKRYSLPNEYILFQGDIYYNKNIPNLVKACKLAKKTLVVVGKQAKEIENMDLDHPELVHLKGIDFSNVIRPGFVEDNDFNKIYNLAYCYVQPSFYEGFGLPLLEAYSSGTPLVVSKAQTLVEIMGLEIKYINPNSPEDIAMGILNPNKNVKLPRIYTWEKTAKETLEVYAKV
ncbi:MAG: Glycosyl transferase, group 1 [Candidatus Woesebacteria bacterium GW2011_GWA1_33_30]|uniref:Glycosyl transferase, group 1 n=1 Tax=Candidatus Woesebacteria bacterium GW2011_GWA2_33_28 TaxID=1618561 RepID=A0A0G0CY57_9BACT|nr:MAG: Glycosyl transferase, group 1 [Candidatus Woesebacteria bacterium GW2011_GWA2_33_28]KKP49084.1 MAG: Glycosyl transferase, group 1 [Candidatus Woesebacteria bacterium GW2011_GWA1_33_30]KKP50316.1 MAG: Glycosyl transferase, group 1 [Microgenomates group bacterium GW2011_GWC1_33_32]KKP52675.1 MAG: Glycosyl transferase, group 1 [Candidatus Woesebacteria bacterium GW2011_GWB1_33_38]KKP56296.1 MAG: Glycosyl transferase, group 1 [Microgenomates group bacterium GW2011_GWD1_33_9]